MAKLIVYSLFSILLLINVNKCRGKDLQSCQESDHSVCATNGTHWYFFKNICQLKSENTNREDYGLGKLDPTDISNCFKHCDQICTDEFAPICATAEDDQKTFPNRCELDLENCRYDNIWNILHEGECHTEPVVNYHSNVYPIPQPHTHPIPRYHSLSHPDVKRLPHKIYQLSIPQSNPIPQKQVQLHINPHSKQHSHYHELAHPQPQVQTQPIPIPNENPVPHPHVQPKQYPHPQQHPQHHEHQYPHPQQYPHHHHQTHPEVQILPIPTPNENLIPQEHVQPYQYPQSQQHSQHHEQGHSQPQVQTQPIPLPDENPVPQPHVQPYQYPQSQQHPHHHEQGHPQLPVHAQPIRNPNANPVPQPHVQPYQYPQSQQHPNHHEQGHPQSPVHTQPIPNPSANPVPQPHVQPYQYPQSQQHPHHHEQGHPQPQVQTQPIPNPIANPVPQPHVQPYQYPQSQQYPHHHEQGHPQPLVQTQPIPNPNANRVPQPHVQPYQYPQQHPHHHEQGHPQPPVHLPIPKPDEGPQFQPHQQPHYQQQPYSNEQFHSQAPFQNLPNPYPNEYPNQQPHIGSHLHPHSQLNPQPQSNYIPHSHPHEQAHPHPQPQMQPILNQNEYPIQQLHQNTHYQEHPHLRPLPHHQTRPHQDPHALVFPASQNLPLTSPQPNVRQISQPHGQTLQHHRHYHSRSHSFTNVKQLPLFSHPNKYLIPQPQVHSSASPQPNVQDLLHPQVQTQPQPCEHPLSDPIPHPAIINRRCPTHCSLEYAPVCASFEGVNQTFENQCFMRADICGSKRAWVVKHNGECIEPESERCNENCPKIYSPMCATFNGQNKTFSNECALDLEICVTGNTWDILYYGECRNPIRNCPKICPNFYIPVCASYNGIQREFPNDCFVLIEACKTNEDWKIVHTDQCEQVKDLPHLPQPPYVPTKNCPDVCPALYNPLCAVLGGSKRTFSNGCELSVEICKTGQNWRALFNGPCESEYQTQLKQPIALLCPSNYEPICATLNGLRKTFTNKCQMDSEIAKTNHAWVILGSGQCERMPPNAQPPFQSPPLTQPPLSQLRIVLPPPLSQPPSQQPTPSNVSALACPLCSDSYQPVCGFFNGQQQTFNNECLLLSENCYSNTKWIVAYEGKCHAVATPRNCPNLCPLNYDPVCATFNGIRRTFPNECELNHEAYKTNNQWVIINVGECDYCPVCSDDSAPVCAELRGRTLTFDNACKVEAENCRTNSAWKIVSKTSCGIRNCPRLCPRIYIPICAISNGEARTFGNVCEMRKEACNTNTAWNIASKGECPGPNENCPQSCSLQYNPICAVYQGVSKEFINECFLRSENCRTHKNWEFVNAGPCTDHTKNQLPIIEPITPTPIAKPESNCQINKCLTFRDPVCATLNGEEKTFSNACFLHNTKCRTGEDWKIINHGSCRKTSSPRSRISPKDVQ